jgi:metal-responsive CopG/Arc/MetJ family transcriptional regulator
MFSQLDVLRQANACGGRSLTIRDALREQLYVECNARLVNRL